MVSSRENFPPEREVETDVTLVRSKGRLPNQLSIVDIDSLGSSVSQLDSHRMPWRNCQVGFLYRYSAVSYGRMLCKIAETGFQAVAFLFMTNDLARAKINLIVHVSIFLFGTISLFTISSSETQSSAK